MNDPNITRNVPGYTRRFAENRYVDMHRASISWHHQSSAFLTFARQKNRSDAHDNGYRGKIYN